MQVVPCVKIPVCLLVNREIRLNLSVIPPTTSSFPSCRLAIKIDVLTLEQLCVMLCALQIILLKEGQEGSCSTHIQTVSWDNITIINHWCVCSFLSVSLETVLADFVSSFWPFLL
jgi:hypothetical protein